MDKARERFYECVGECGYSSGTERVSQTASVRVSECCTSQGVQVRECQCIRMCVRPRVQVTGCDFKANMVPAVSERDRRRCREYRRGIESNIVRAWHSTVFFEVTRFDGQGYANRII